MDLQAVREKKQSFRRMKDLLEGLAQGENNKITWIFGVFLALVQAAPLAVAQDNPWIKAAGSIVAAPISWLVWGSILYAGCLMLGGRSSYTQMFRIALLAWIPCGLRAILQAGFILITGSQVVNPGLSGFTPGLPPGSLAVLLRHLLSQVDIFQIWSLSLLINGAVDASRLPSKKVVGLVLGGWSGLALLGAVPGLAGLGIEKMLEGWI